MLAGWLLAFTLSLDDVVIASFVSGPGATTLADADFLQGSPGCDAGYQRAGHGHYRAGQCRGGGGRLGSTGGEAASGERDRPAIFE